MNTPHQFLRFLVVGALNTFFGYFVFAGLVFADVPEGPALVFTYVIGIFFNFFTTRRFVFNRAAKGALLRFISSYVVIYFFNLGFYKLFQSLDTTPLLTQALCLPIVAVFTFTFFKLQVFRD